MVIDVRCTFPDLIKHIPFYSFGFGVPFAPVNPVPGVIPQLFTVKIEEKINGYIFSYQFFPLFSCLVPGF